MAKAMGLHKAQATSNGSNAEERQERWMVCRSLYLRDKGFTVTRGSVSWLPEFNFNQILGINGDRNPVYSSRLELASLQDKIYRLANSIKSIPSSSTKVQESLNRIQQGLKDLAQSHGLFSTNEDDCSPRHTALQLDFLATRIGALQESPVSSHGRLVRMDARVSCLLLLLARGDGNQTVQERYNQLMLSCRSQYPPPSNQDTTLQGIAMGSDDPISHKQDRTWSRTLLGLLDGFPASAFFVLMRYILWPSE
ncbi:MAG: hypothetical protein Q9219_007251 [cf. Caloplaca sp. 3 TL-2023]